MKPNGIFFFLPAIVLITFFGFGAGTALAHSGPGAWNISPNDAQVFSNQNEALVGIGPLEGTRVLASTHAATGAKRRAFVGTVDSITGSAVESITGSAVVLILQGTAVEQTIFVPEELVFKTPGGKRAGTFAEEARVVILAERDGEGWIAIRGLVKPENPMYAPTTGVVTDVDGDVITLESPDGDVQTLTLPDEAEDVVPGEVITVFEEGSGKVTGLVKAAQVQARLNQFLEDAGDDEGDEESSDDTDQRSRRAQALTRVLENFGAQHLEVLNRVADRAPERVRLQIQTTKARVESDQRNSRLIIERVKARLQWTPEEDDPDGDEELRPQGKGKQVDNAGGQNPNQSSGGGEEDGSGSAGHGRPATAGGPGADDQDDGDDTEPPEEGKRPDFGSLGKNR